MFISLAFAHDAFVICLLQVPLSRVGLGRDYDHAVEAARLPAAGLPRIWGRSWRNRAIHRVLIALAPEQTIQSQSTNVLLMILLRRRPGAAMARVIQRPKRSAATAQPLMRHVPCPRCNPPRDVLGILHRLRGSVESNSISWRGQSGASLPTIA